MKDLQTNASNKEICVLSVVKRWWDLEKDCFDIMSKQLEFQSTFIAQLIFEFAGFSWCLTKFHYPLIKDGKDLSEVLKSINIDNHKFLLMGRLARDPKTKIQNRWAFHGYPLPNTFEDMWKDKNIKKKTILKSKINFDE